jgi:endonuclease-8
VPEGDTIWRTARTLEAALAGKVVLRFQSSLPHVAAASLRLGIVGQAVTTVEARGKHLLVRFGNGVVLHTHQGMMGSWRLRLPAPSPPRLHHPRAVLEVEGAVAVCQRAPVVEVLSPRAARDHPALSRLGPDVLRPDFEPRIARERLRTRHHVEIGVALLDQTAIAGVGNLYKSEVLFSAGVSPFLPVGELDDDALDRLIAFARDLMRRNLASGGRRTTTGLAPGPLWVYRRAGRPCRRCGAAVRRASQGEQARSTYFCPRCQGPPSPPAGPFTGPRQS